MDCCGPMEQKESGRLKCGVEDGNLMDAVGPVPTPRVRSKFSGFAGAAPTGANQDTFNRLRSNFPEIKPPFGYEKFCQPL